MGDSGMSNFRTAAQGGGNVEIVTGSSVLKGGSTSAPAKVDAAYIEWNTANIVVPGKSGTAANLKGGGSAQNAPTDLNEKVITLYQIHDFDADSVGHKTGGIAGLVQPAGRCNVRGWRYWQNIRDLTVQHLGRGPAHQDRD